MKTWFLEVIIVLCSMNSYIAAQGLTGKFELYKEGAHWSGANILSLMGPQGWVFQDQGDGYQTPLDFGLPYTAYTTQEREVFSGQPPIVNKHLQWDIDPGSFKLLKQFTAPLFGRDVIKSSHFDRAYPVAIYNNREQFEDCGYVSFRDPWYLDQDGNQNGEFIQFDGPLTPTGSVFSNHGAVFMDRQIDENEPFYSARFLTEQQDLFRWCFIDAFATTANDLDMSKMGLYDYWSWSGGRWVRENEFNIDVTFRNPGAELYGFYKRHLGSSSEQAPTAINSQRKLSQEARGTIQDPQPSYFHQVYESLNKIYYTWSEDGGDSWEGEVLVSEFAHTCFHPAIDVSDKTLQHEPRFYIAYVDASDNLLYVKYRTVGMCPAEWETIYTASITSPGVTHPSIATLVYDDNESEDYITVVIWEDGFDIRYTILNNGTVLNGDRRINGVTTPVDFDNLVLATGTSVPLYSHLTPKYPSIEKGYQGHPLYGDLYQFGAVWSERPMQVLRYKGMDISLTGSTYLVQEGNPFTFTQNLPIRDNSAPSITSAELYPLVAYEYDNGNTSTYPTPTNTSTPISLGGRTYYPIVYPHFGYNYGRTTNYSRVVYWFSPSSPRFRLYDITTFNNVRKIINIPSQNSYFRSPSIEYGPPLPGIPAPITFVTANLDEQTYGEYAVASTGNGYNWFYTASGKYPQMSGNSEYLRSPLITYSYDQYSWLTYNCTPQYLTRVDIMDDIKHTRKGVTLPKRVETTETDCIGGGVMREFMFTVNDTARILYGVNSPILVSSDSEYTCLTWDDSSDSTEYQWWDKLRTGLRTAPFTVIDPVNVEFGTEILVRYPGDFGDAFRIVMEFRDTESDSVLLSSTVDLAGIEVDSSLYLLDRVDLSPIEGQSVYLCFNPIDSVANCDFIVAEIRTPFAAGTEKEHYRGSGERPVHSTLRQNYPNPFNPQTTIPYRVTARERVRIEVFDPLGRSVGLLIDEYHNPGEYYATFDGSNLSDGVYFCVMSTSDVRSAIKMVVVK